MMTSFEPTHQEMRHLQLAMQDTLQGVISRAAPKCPSLEGAVLFAQDTAHENEAGAIAVANVPRINPDLTKFQRQHVLGRRIDLGASALGGMFESRSGKIDQSMMNPEQHLVAGLMVQEEAGARVNGLVQLAFTKESDTPVDEQLKLLQDYWLVVKGAFAHKLDKLHAYGDEFPSGSTSDALKLNLPTVPNAFAISWDTTGSRQIDYATLNYDLVLRGKRFLDIIERGGGRLLQSTGDGQSFALDLPTGPMRLSRREIGKFALDKLAPILRDLTVATQEEGSTPARFTVDLGRIDETPLGPNGPVLFSNATVSERQRGVVGFGTNMRGILSNADTQTS